MKDLGRNLGEEDLDCNSGSEDPGRNFGEVEWYGCCSRRAGQVREKGACSAEGDIVADVAAVAAQGGEAVACSRIGMVGDGRCEAGGSNSRMVVVMGLNGCAGDLLAAAAVGAAVAAERRGFGLLALVPHACSNVISHCKSEESWASGAYAGSASGL